jgi:hypothetical protein
LLQSINNSRRIIIANCGGAKRHEIQLARNQRFSSTIVRRIVLTAWTGHTYQYRR